MATVVGRQRGTFASTFRMKGKQEGEKLFSLKFLSTSIPIVLAVLGYGLEVDVDEGDNAQLNTAGHAFSCSMRFEGIWTEWLLLWCHFVWSGVLTIMFCLVTWKKIGRIFFLAHPNARCNDSESMKQRRRLLKISLMVSFCLILNAISRASIALKLNGWSKTADQYLACEIKETWNSRDWRTYGFNDNEIVNVCSKDATKNVSSFTCASDCFWYPSLTTEYLTCIEKGSGIETWEDYVEDRLQHPEAIHPCDCPCDYLVHTERPSATILILTYAAQSLVVIVVALTLGFRNENLLLWKKFGQRLAKMSTSVAAEKKKDTSAFLVDSDKGKSQGRSSDKVKSDKARAVCTSNSAKVIGPPMAE